LTLSRATRESMDPVPLLGEAWVLESDDGSPEFRIAAALAGLHGRKRNDDGAERSCLPMGMHFAPIDERRRWLEGSGQDVTWGSDTVENNLRALVERRLLLAGRVDPLDTPWEARYRAPLHAIAAWLDGGLDSARIGRLLRGLVLARIPRKLGHAQRLHLPVPPSFAVLKPMFSPGRQLNRVIRGASAGDDAGNDSTDGWPARDAAAIARLLAADRVGDAVSLGLRRMRAGGLRPLIEPFDVGQPDGRRLLAALLVPLSDADLRRTLYRVATRDPDRDTNTSPQFLEA
ncbi:MAG: hypothetical protein ACRELT_00745, partial [Longimicrobiales bacterium]